MREVRITYDDATVRRFLLASVFWGIVGMLLGVVIDSLLGTVRFQAQRWGYECGPH